MYPCGHPRTPENSLRSQSSKGRCRTCHCQTQRRREWGYAGIVVDGRPFTQADFDAQVEAQSGLCAICAEPMRPGKDTHADHDHATGEFRGLLCSSCNLGLGKFKDDRATLLAATEYLTA